MKRVFSVLLALAFVLSLSGCVSRDTYKTDIIETAESSYERGFEEGYDEGYYFGADDYYEIGYDEGYEKGEDVGYKKGRGDGYSEGYASGHADGQNVTSPVYITLDSNKYHNYGCQYLNSWPIVISRLQAFYYNYTACSVCCD